MTTYRDFNIGVGALCAWREARNETVGPTSTDGMRAVLHVIDNRSKRHNMTWAQVVYQKLQFSSMTYSHDLQLCRVPAEDDEKFLAALVLAQSVYSSLDTDLTLGADYYFNPDIVVPIWAKDLRELIKIGHHDFFREP